MVFRDIWAFGEGCHNVCWCGSYGYLSTGAPRYISECLMCFFGCRLHAVFAQMAASVRLKGGQKPKRRWPFAGRGGGDPKKRVVRRSLFKGSGRFFVRSDMGAAPILR